MDEHGQTGSGAADRRNGTGLADPSTWPGAATAEHTWSSAGAALEPSADGVEWLTPAGAPAAAGASARAAVPVRDDGPRSAGSYRQSYGNAESHAPADGHGQDAGGRHAQGLDDDTPPGGMPAVEPPLWREAARRAAGVNSAPPAPPASPAPARHATVPATAPEEPDVAAEPATAEFATGPAAGATPGYADPPTPQWEEAPPETGSGWVNGRSRAVWEAAPETNPGWDPAPEDATEPPDPTAEHLPQRVPAEPDVPDLGEPGAVTPAEAPQLARIADQLRRDDVPSERAAPETLDVDAVLDAVRGVAGVRAAALRTNPDGAATLRLDLADDADPIQVSRVVARLLQEQMGLSAAPHVPQARPPQEVAGDEPAHDEPAYEPAREASTRERAAETADTWPAGPAPADPALASEAPRSRPLAGDAAAPRVVIDQVQVNVEGMDATVEVRLAAGRRRALGLASGPAIDSYVVRLAAVSAAKAVDELMRDDRPPVPDDAASRCFVEHTGVVPFGATEVAVVVVLLVCGGWVEQLAGSAVVDGDARHAAVRATLGAVNRRLDALLAQ